MVTNSQITGSAQGTVGSLSQTYDGVNVDTILEPNLPAPSAPRRYWRQTPFGNPDVLAPDMTFDDLVATFRRPNSVGPGPRDPSVEPVDNEMGTIPAVNPLGGDCAAQRIGLLS
ncbi:MAG: hypothetical protein K0U93_15860 [Gammaproteobacteria bacterium]|nr:hypothetical protein [Gammaproteobacteria bacterium]